MAHDDREMIPHSQARDSAERGGYLIIGAAAAIALIGAYIVLGTPGLHTQVARAPVEASATQ
jgi:hypothetical protein